MSFTKDSASTTNRVSLANSTNWEMWHQDFKSKAVGYDLWNYIQGIKALLSNPERPAMEDFAIKRTAATALATRPQSVIATQDTVEEISAEAASTDRHLPGTRSPTFGDLTTDGQKAYQVAWGFYQDDMKLYREQQDFLRKLKDWVTDTITPHYRRLCCEPTDPLSKWYTNLKEAVGVTSYIEKKEATRLYQEATKSPKGMKDFDNWIDNWEQGMNMAQRKKVAATLSPSDWFNDLMKALAGILPNWSESYAIHKGDEVENETLTFRTVANDLRKVVDRNQKGTNKFAKGSFGPTFAEEEQVVDRNQKGTNEYAKGSFGPTFAEAEHADAGPENSPEISMNKQRKRGSRKKDAEFRPKRTANHILRGNSEDILETSCVCRACEGLHLTRRCFYIFPDSRPKNWKPNKQREKIVDKNLKEDSTLAEEIKRWGKKKDGGKNRLE
jgi:hypothetical protein